MQVIGCAGHATVLIELQHIGYAESQDDANDQDRDQEFVQSEAVLGFRVHAGTIKGHGERVSTTRPTAHSSRQAVGLKTPCLT
jgi:hypothetical protein